MSLSVRTTATTVEEREGERVEGGRDAPSSRHCYFRLDKFEVRKR